MERQLDIIAFKSGQTFEKKEIKSMIIEALAKKEDKEESAARSASKKLLELCRGAKKKSVGMIGLNLLSPDFVPSLPKPTLKSVLMLPGLGMGAQEYQPVNRSGARDASEAKAGDVGEETKKNGENPISAMSKKVCDEENLKKINDNRHKSDRNDVEKNVNSDRLFKWSRKFYKKGIRKFYKKGIGKRRRSCW